MIGNLMVRKVKKGFVIHYLREQKLSKVGKLVRFRVHSIPRSDRCSPRIIVNGP